MTDHMLCAKNLTEMMEEIIYMRTDLYSEPIGVPEEISKHLQSAVESMDKALQLVSYLYVMGEITD